MNIHSKYKIFDATNYFLLSIIALITLFPVYHVLCLSLTSQAEYLKGGLILYPRGITLENFKYLVTTPLFPRAAGVSAYLAIVGTALGLIVTSALSYSLSRKRMMGRKALVLLILFTTLFQPGMIPNYLLIRNLGLIDNLWAIILPMLSSGWNVFLMRSFFENVPESLEEAAIIDGCSDFGVWWKIILPLSLPALATFGLFFAVAYWNVFFNAMLYINDSKLWPLQMVLRQLFVDSNTSSAAQGEVAMLNPETFKMAAVIVTITPIIAVYPFLQKHFAKGVMLGSVKG